MSDDPDLKALKAALKSAPAPQADAKDSALRLAMENFDRLQGSTEPLRSSQDRPQRAGFLNGVHVMLNFLTSRPALAGTTSIAALVIGVAVILPITQNRTPPVMPKVTAPEAPSPVSKTAEAADAPAVLEGRELERLNDVPVYDGTLTLNVPALAPWYAKAMDLDPAARYRNASEALDALNACLAVDAGPDVCAADFEGYETDAGPMTLMAKRVISSVPTKMVYESEQNGGRVLVKCWPQLKYDPKYLARNLRLLAFLQKARSLRQSGFNAAPEVLDFGLNTFGLMLVTRWTEGRTLTEWLAASPDVRQRALLAHALLNAVRRLSLIHI